MSLLSIPTLGYSTKRMGRVKMTLSPYKNGFISWLATAAETYDMELVLQTSSGTIIGTPYNPIADPPTATAMSLLASTFDRERDKEKEKLSKDELDKLPQQALFLKDVRVIGTPEITFSEIVVFFDQISAASLSGNWDLESIDLSELE